jgi:hypothetical protein
MGRLNKYSQVGSAGRHGLLSRGPLPARCYEKLSAERARPSLGPFAGMPKKLSLSVCGVCSSY